MVYGYRASPVFELLCKKYTILSTSCFIIFRLVLASNECQPYLILGGKTSTLIKHDLTTGHQDYELFSSHMTFGQVNSFAFDADEGLFFLLS